MAVMYRYGCCILMLLLCTLIEDVSSKNLHGKVVESEKRELEDSTTVKTTPVKPLKNETEPVIKLLTTASTMDSNTTNNQTDNVFPKNLFDQFKNNKDMLMRTFYVLLGVTAVVVLYFVIKAVRVRRRKSRTRRYGLLAGGGDKLEMTPLDQDDDDEDDVTVFEMNGKKR